MMLPLPANIFVLCTGRCGSTTFIRAMEHCTNYTSGHETRTHMLGESRFAYPPRHIEADNRLSWLLGRLDRHFGKDALYVHLLRDPEKVAASFVRRADRGIMLAYRTEILMHAPKRSNDASMADFAHDYVETVTANIRHFLQDKPAQMTFHLEDAERRLPDFWSMIGAEGNLEAARAEFNIQHNASR